MARTCRLSGFGPALGLVLALSLVPFVVAQQPEPAAFLLDGRRLSGRLAGVDSDWSIRLASPSGAESAIAGDNLVSWGGFREGRKGPLILLTDGSRIVADVVRLAADDLVIESAYWSEARLPIEFVRGIVLRPSINNRNRDRLIERVTNATPGQDLLLLAQDRLAGTIVPGGKKDDDFRQVWIRPKNRREAVAVGVGKITAIVFNPSVASLPKRDGLSALVGFRDGSRLNLRRVTRGDDHLMCEFDNRVRLQFASAAGNNLWSWIVSVRPWHSQVVYLSDVKPLAYKHQPFLSLAWPYRVDRNVLNRPLRHAGQLFGKGLGMHSRSRIAYELNGRFERFDAELAIDDEAQRMGSVVFRVYLQPFQADKTPGNWVMKYESPVVRGGAPAVPLSLDVRNIFRMALIVDYADRGDERDYANWLNARLIRTKASVDQMK